MTLPRNVNNFKVQNSNENCKQRMLGMSNSPCFHNKVFQAIISKLMLLTFFLTYQAKHNFHYPMSSVQMHFKKHEVFRVSIWKFRKSINLFDTKHNFEFRKRLSIYLSRGLNNELSLVSSFEGRYSRRDHRPSDESPAHTAQY